MKTIKIPYYTSSLDLHVDEKNLEAVITARTDEYEAGKSEEELVKEALEHPIGTPRLSELAKGKNRIVLVTSDHTRAVPSKLTLPLLLAEIRKGNPDADITILISSHILEELSKLCTDFGIIHKGSLIKELSQEQLMQQCEKRLELVVDEPQKAMTVLDSMNIHDYEAVDPTHLHVYERLEDSMLINRELVNAGVLPREMKVNQEELESYFLNLTSD